MWHIQKDFDLKCHHCGRQLGLATKENIIVYCSGCVLNRDREICNLALEVKDLQFQFDVKCEQLRICKKANEHFVVLIKELERRKNVSP